MFYFKRKQLIIDFFRTSRNFLDPNLNTKALFMLYVQLIFYRIEKMNRELLTIVQIADKLRGQEILIDLATAHSCLQYVRFVQDDVLVLRIEETVGQSRQPTAYKKYCPQAPADVSSISSPSALRGLFCLAWVW